VTVVDPDSDDDDGNGTILVGLMQKERRKLKREGKDNLTIGYAVYKVSDFFIYYNNNNNNNESHLYCPQKCKTNS